MPRADFYLIQKDRFREQPLLLVCELAKRALAAQQPTLILARDPEQAEELDELLWAFDDDAYLPHQIAGVDEDDAVTPLLVVVPGTETPDRPMVINLRDEAVSGQFERVLEVVPADESAREPLRHAPSVRIFASLQGAPLDPVDVPIRRQPDGSFTATAVGQAWVGRARGRFDLLFGLSPAGRPLVLPTRVDAREARKGNPVAAWLTVPVDYRRTPRP